MFNIVLISYRETTFMQKLKYGVNNIYYNYILKLNFYSLITKYLYVFFFFTYIINFILLLVSKQRTIFKPGFNQNYIELKFKLIINLF